jgi:hypothetical protein
VSDSKKFGTRDPAHTGGPELPEGRPATFGKREHILCFRICLRIPPLVGGIPGPMLPSRARAWHVSGMGGGAGTHPSGSTRNTLATL